MPDALAMGKAGRAEPEQAFPNAAPATRVRRCRCGAVVGKVASGKCVSLLLLAVGGFLSALFMLLHLRASGGGVPDDPDILAGKSRDFTHSEELIQKLHDYSSSKESKRKKKSSVIEHENTTCA